MTRKQINGASEEVLHARFDALDADAELDETFEGEGDAIVAELSRRADGEERHYRAQYDYACGYHD